MSEQTIARPCQWPECEEAATRHAGRVAHPGIKGDETGGSLIHNRVTRYDLCGRNFEELNTYGGVIEPAFLDTPRP